MSKKNVTCSCDSKDECVKAYIESLMRKYYAIRLLRDFSKIGKAACDSLRFFEEKISDTEYALVSDTVGDILKNELFNIIYPTIKLFPELRPTSLLLTLKDKVKYNLMFMAYEYAPPVLMKSGIPAKIADHTLLAYDKAKSTDDAIYWIELDEEGQKMYALLHEENRKKEINKK